MKAGVQSRWLATGLACAVVGLLLAIAILRIFTRFPFFDEVNNARFLWMLSQGLRPYEDFWCSYAQPAFIVTLPFFRLLPESAYNLIVLRFFAALMLVGVGGVLAWHGRRTGCHILWGLAPFAALATLPPVSRFWAEFSIDHYAALAAAGALGLFFLPPTPRRMGLAALCSVWSVAVTPKYGLILLGGGAGYLWTALWNDRARALRYILAGAAGFAVGLGVVWWLYWMADVSFTQALYWVYYIQSQYNGRLIDRGDLWASILKVLLRGWPTGLLLLGGLCAWAWRHPWKDVRANWAPAGLVAGSLMYVATVHQALEQYYTPVLVALLFFTPFISGVLARWGARKELTLGVAVCALLAVRLILALPELRQTPLNARDSCPQGFKVLSGPPGYRFLRTTQWLLQTIPPDERVAAGWPYHPMFRRDATYMTVDDRPSLVHILPAGHSARWYFSTAYFQRELDQHPPGLFCPVQMEVNLPEGWFNVAAQFLLKHQDMYARINVGTDLWLYIRKDLYAMAPARPH